jgi:tRNA pseudouridine55 synthase
MKSGILLVDKPAGMSSAAVVAKVKKKFRFDKIGHGGTLDPFATGLLVLLVGEATKVSRFFLGGKKAYEALAIAGKSTSTGDATGEVIAEGPLPAAGAWAEKLAQFQGEISQIPPMYSALKRDGKALYEYARAGQEVDREPRKVEISKLEILMADNEKMQFRVQCSGGTYVRTLAEDWARASGSMAYLQELRRLTSGQFSIADAHTLEDILAWPGDTRPPLVPLLEALSYVPKLHCSADEAAAISRGRQDIVGEIVRANDAEINSNSRAEEYFLLACATTPIALLRRHSEAKRSLEIERVFVFDPASRSS